MKKSFILITGIIVALLLALTLSYADGENPTFLEGDAFLRAGDTYSVRYSVAESGFYGFQGTLGFDGKNFKIVSSSSLADGWSFEITSDGKFLAFSNNLPATEKDEFGNLVIKEEGTPFQGGGLFEVVFSVSESLEADSDISFTVRDTIASTMTEDKTIANADFVKLSDPPESSDTTLSTFVVTTAQISPAFSPDVREYTANTVGYEVTALEIITKATNTRAKVEIIGNELEVGNNTVIVRVTAENGTSGDYVIKVKRDHSSDQALSDDARLSQITLSEGILSPAFSPDVFDYIVYLPFETKSIDVKAEPLNPFAREVEVNNVTGELLEGENEIKIICTAENTKKSEYSIRVFVMPKYDGDTPDISDKQELTGTLALKGDKKIGGTITATLENLAGNSYTVTWFKDGEKIAEGAEYTLSNSDKGHTVYAVALGNGNYIGSVQSEKITIDENGKIGTSTSDGKTTLSSKIIWLVAAIVASVFLSAGIIIGEIKGKKKASGSEKVTEYPEKETIKTESFDIGQPSSHDDGEDGKE